MKTKVIVFLFSFIAFNAFTQNLKEADKAFGEKEFVEAKKIYSSKIKKLTPKQNAKLGFCIYLEENYVEAATYFETGLSALSRLPARNRSRRTGAVVTGRAVYRLASLASNGTNRHPARICPLGPHAGSGSGVLSLS